MLIDLIVNYKIEIFEKENEILFLKLKINWYEVKNVFREIN